MVPALAGTVSQHALTIITMFNSVLLRQTRLAAIGGLVASAILAVSAAESPGTPAPLPSHADLVRKFDQNGDGRLDASEREAMRSKLKIQRLAKKSGFKIPQEFLDKYDQDKDGEMVGDEWRVAWEAETKILRETYDADKDGELNKAERKSMMADVAAGKITGIPAYFAGRMGDDPKMSTPVYVDEQKALLSFDADGDGIASADELKKIRQDRQKIP